MTDGALHSTGPFRIANASVFLATIAGIIVLIVLLLSFDLFLAGLDRRESAARAAAEYSAGVTLLREGRADGATERFGNAVSIDRTNVRYSLALADAMLEEGKLTDAEATLRALLDRAENDGAVNLTMARVMVREGHADEAKAYFHRAIFGRWGADSAARRRQTRFELIDLLAKSGSSRELLAELLPFEEVPPDSVALRRRLGGLFLQAGSPARAGAMYREVLRHDPEDGDAYAGMGEAALAAGNLRTARADFAEAARLRPDDPKIASRRALADTVLALDPTERGIAASEQYARSRALLARTVDDVGTCGPLAGALADSARRMLSRALGPTRASVGEAMVSLAIGVWDARPAPCRTPRNDDALRLVQNRLAQ
jgi:Tfp pilus assembly protein PilF